LVYTPLNDLLKEKIVEKSLKLIKFFVRVKIYIFI